MKKKSLNRKLALSRETVRSLTSPELAAAHGGVIQTHILNTCAVSYCVVCSQPCTTV